MREVLCLVGLDEPESQEIRDMLDSPVIAHDILPEIVVLDGVLSVEYRGRMVPVSKLVYHGIFEDDLDFITGLALWGGPVYPNPVAMMNCRLKLPCLVRALQYTRFGEPARGYASAHARINTDSERVAKWGNWHCGENKVRFQGTTTLTEPSIIEDFLPGKAVRIVMIGEHYWQIQLEGDDWLKSIHHTDAGIIDEVDAELLADTRAVRDGFGLSIIANDYIVGLDGSRHLLEVNHIPNVTRFPEIWTVFRNTVVTWLQT
jgi:hypothetical protein